MELNINIYGLISFLSALINLLIGFFVLTRNFKNKVNRVYFASSISLLIWGVSEAMQRSVTTADVAYFIFTFAIPLGSTIYPATLLHFLNHLIDNKKYNTKIINFSLYLPSVFFVFLRFFRPEMLATGMLREPWGYSPEAAPLYFVYTLYIGLSVLLGTIISIIYSYQSKGRTKKQAFLIALGSLIAVSSGIVTQVIAPQLKWHIPEMSVTFSAIYSALIAIAVTKYGLMTISPEEAASNILETIEDFIIVANKDMKIEMVNKAVLLKLHYRKEELIDQPVNKIFKNEVPQLNIADATKRLTIYRKNYFQTNVLTKEGLPIPVSFDTADIIDPDKKTVGYTIVMRDMREVNNYIEKLQNKTDESNAKQIKLEEHQREILNILEDVKTEKEKTKKYADRLELATKSAKIGVFEWDIAKNHLTWDKQTEKILGSGRVKLSGAIETWINENIHPDDKNLVKKGLDESLQGKKDFNLVYRVVWPDRSAHYIRNSSSIKRDENNKPLKAVGVCWDVTQEMEIDKAKTEFVSLASHQLRTPLSAINWYAEMLLAGDAGKLNHEQKQYINEIYQGNQRMVGLVNSLLNVSRLELGTFSIEPELAQITVLADDIIKELKPQIEKKKIKFSKRYRKDLPTIMLDKKLTSIIFQNLLSNAVKYTPAEGNIKLDIDADKNNLLIMVTDTGLGIPLSQKNKIFTKLFRADNVLSSDTEGTGLGLYIVKSIIENVGGEISFVSTENKGTTFYIALPLSGMAKKEGAKTLT